MKTVLILILGLVFFGCNGGGKKGGGSARPTDTTELHGQVANVVLKGKVESIQDKAEKFVLVASTGDLITVKVHETVFLWGEAEVEFETLSPGLTVTVSGIQNPGIVKADTVWIE